MTSGSWPAPRALAPVDAVVPVPGSKSVTNRALVLAALARGSSLLRRPLRSRDTALMADALRALGVRVEPADSDGGDLRVTSAGPPYDGVGAIDAGNAGTVARFLPPLAGLAVRDVHLDGDPRIRERPLRPLLTALRALGVAVSDHGRGALPITVHGTGRVGGGTVAVDAAASSQFVSGLLLASPGFDDGLDLRSVGSTLPSRPHVAMTVAMLRAAGAAVEQPEPDRWRVAPATLRPGVLEVEPDLSSAAPFLAAALVTGGRVTVPGWPTESLQPGALLPGLLERMGAACTCDERGLTVSGGGRVLGIDADLGDAGELVPVLAAVAALADGPSRLRNVGHLRGQETDRLAALARELSALGAEVTETADGLAVRPRPLRGGLVSTYDDHRLAMAAAVVGLAVDGIRVENVGTTAKTLPEFPAMWAALGHAGARGEAVR